MEFGSRISSFLDSDGNIVYQQSGVHPRRPENVSGLMPVKGWEAKNRWKGILQPHELVRVVNPSDGMIVSANNDVNDMLEKNHTPKNNHSGTRSSLNIHMGPYRRNRILTLLKNKSSQKNQKHTMESMLSIQTDTAAPERLRNALMAIVEQELQRQVNNNSRSAQLLSEWDGRYSSDSLGALVFDRTYRSILDEIYGGVVFGRDVWAYLQSNTELFNVFSEIFDRPIFFDQSDDDPLEVFTSESKTEMVTRIFIAVLEELDAELTAISWGTTNTLTMPNILFEDQFPFPQLGYSYGPFPMAGALGVVWQGASHQQLGRTKSVSASWRFLSDLGNATIASSLPGGPSGNRLDGHLYVSGIKEHLQGKYDYFTLS
jgi:penicillin amidase